VTSVISFLEKMKHDEDFTVYLRSVECLGSYPYNKASEFTNSISDKIELSDDFEVALQNIIFNPKFEAISAEDKRFNIWISMKFFHKDIENIQWNKNDGIELMYIPSINIGGDDNNTCVRQLNNDLVDFLINHNLIDYTYQPILHYDSKTNKIKYNKLKPPKDSIYSSYRTKLTFSRAFMDMLGLEAASNSTTKPAFLYPMKINIPESIFIYSDIIKPSNMGNQCVNILDILPNSDIYAKNTVSPVYKPVNLTNINSISIKLLDEYGSQIAFHESVRVTIVLHFRVKK